MLHELYELGKSVQQLSEKDNSSVQGVKGVNHVLLVNLESEDGSYKYHGVTFEGYMPEHAIRYLYRKKASNGPEYLPTYLLNGRKKEGDDIDKQTVLSTLQKKFVAWFNSDNADKYWGGFRDDPVLGAISKAIMFVTSKQQAISTANADSGTGNLMEDFWETYRRLDSGGETQGKGNYLPKVLVSVLFRDGDAFYYLGDFNNGMFSTLLAEVVNNAASGDSRGSSGGIGTCGVCNKSNIPVTGLALSKAGYKFSVTDKYVMIMGMKFSDAWKAMPVCEDCALVLRNSYKYVTETLSFPRQADKDKKQPTFPLNFWVIPSYSAGMTVKALRDFEAILNDGSMDGLMVADDQLVHLARAGALRGFQYNFLFHTMDSGKRHMTLNAYVADILPSRLTELHEIQDGIRMLNLCNEGITKTIFFRELKTPMNLVDYLAGSGPGWPFVFLYQQYTRVVQTGSGTKRITEDTYYRLVESIFAGSELRIDVIKTFIVSARKHYRAIFDKKSREGYSGFQKEVIKTFLLYRYLIDSRAIKGDINMTTNEVGGYPATSPANGRTASGNYSTLDDLFKDLRIGMADEERLASIAVGVLVNKALCVQRHERGISDKDRGKEPFWSNLNDLNVDLQLLRKIATKALDKLADYQKMGLFGNIEGEAMTHLSRIQGQSHLSRDELSYYFSVGLVMGDAVARCPLDETGKSRGWC